MLRSEVVRRLRYHGHVLEVFDIPHDGWRTEIHPPTHSGRSADRVSNTVAYGLEVLLEEAKGRVLRPLDSRPV